MITMQAFLFQEQSTISLWQNIGPWLIIAIATGVAVELLVRKTLGLVRVISGKHHGISQIVAIVCYPAIALGCLYIALFSGKLLGVFEEFSFETLKSDTLRVFLLLAIVAFVTVKIVTWVGQQLTKVRLHILLSIVFAPIIEELLTRYFILNSLTISGVSLVNALILASITFGLAHIMTRDHQGRWNGGLSIINATILGFYFGFIAISFGIIAAIVAHALHNLMVEITQRQKS